MRSIEEEIKANALRHKRVTEDRRRANCGHVGRTCSSFPGRQCGCLCQVCGRVREVMANR